jgi:hypothetical protein
VAPALPSKEPQTLRTDCSTSTYTLVRGLHVHCALNDLSTESLYSEAVAVDNRTLVVLITVSTLASEHESNTNVAHPMFWI